MSSDLALYDAMLHDLRMLMRPGHASGSPNAPFPAQGFYELEIEWSLPAQLEEVATC